MKIHTKNDTGILLQSLACDCANCCGLCCVALYFAKAEGFPCDKPAGKPCANLLPDFRCDVHAALAQRKLKGCIAYDCFGAGQKVSQTVYGGTSWRQNPQQASQMFDVFLIVRQLHQMLWYLVEASSLVPAQELRPDIGALIFENTRMTQLSPEEIIKLDVGAYRTQVNNVLKKAGQLVLAAANKAGAARRSTDYIGKNFKKANLDGTDFSMCLLIAANLERCSLRAANFLGADLRDANLSDANLSESIFLTQQQINTAKGNRATRLPPMLTMPCGW